MREEKVIALAELKAEGDASGPGSISGYGSTFGNIDSYGDTVDPGAYKDTISEFLSSGFMAWGHDWADPIATVKSAHEDAKGLYITGEYHTDSDAQKIRTRVAERLNRGQTMGLSIGYEAVEWEMRQVETPFRGMFGELTDKVRALTKIKLYEVSIVTVPADSSALVTSSKSTNFSFEDHSERVRVAVSEWLERSKAGAALRVKEGRAISEARRARMASVSESLRASAKEIDAMLEETAPAPKSADPSRLRFEHDRLIARLARDYGLGVPA